MNNPETQAPLDTIGMTKTNTNKNIAQRIKKISNRVTNIYSQRTKTNQSKRITQKQKG
jgi:hypothetical protein